MTEADRAEIRRDDRPCGRRFQSIEAAMRTHQVCPVDDCGRIVPNRFGPLCAEHDAEAWGDGSGAGDWLGVVLLLALFLAGVALVRCL